MSRVVIIGSSYAGLTAALELRRHLPKTDTVTVVSITENFFFLPSLIWIAQGWRELDEISFPVQPVLDEAGVGFIQARLEQIQPEIKTLSLDNGQSLAYDKLLIASGGEWAWDAVPGSQPKPEGHTISILSPSEAMKAHGYWQEFLANPGPVVIGLALQSSLYGAAYEFALNLEVALRQAGVRNQATITFITPEPFLGHLGHGGLGNSRQILEDAFLSQGITWLTEAQIERIEANEVILGGTRRVNSKFTMIVPPYRGIKPVREVPGLADAEGRIPVDAYYRSQANPDIFAAGVAVQVKPVDLTLLPCGVFITGSVSAEMGRVAAANIAADLGYGPAVAKSLDALKSFFVLDSGSHGLFMSLGAQSWLNLQVNLPGPWSHWAKVMIEKYQMRQLQTGKY